MKNNIKRERNSQNVYVCVCVRAYVQVESNSFTHTHTSINNKIVYICRKSNRVTRTRRKMFQFKSRQK